MSFNGQKSWKTKVIEPKVTPLQVIFMCVFIGYAMFEELSLLVTLDPKLRLGMKIGLYLIGILASGNFDFKKFLLKCRDVFDDMSEEDRTVMNLLENVIKEAFYHWNMRYERDSRVIKIAETKEQKIARIQKELAELDKLE